MSENTPFYFGTSMLRVFVPGDTIVLEDIAFEDIQIGDIIAFSPKTENEHPIIHRVIDRTDETIITQGDNNDAADEPIDRSRKPKLAVMRITVDGHKSPILRGRAGLRQFCRNRRCRFVKNTVGALLKPLLPLMFWRIRLTESQTFGEEIHYYRKGKMIARRCGTNIIFTPYWKKLFYKISE